MTIEMRRKKKTILWYLGKWIGWPVLILEWAVDQFFDGATSWEKKDAK